MFWKSRPYWLKGGAVAVSMVILIFLLYYFIWVPFFTDSIVILLLLIPGLLLSSPLLGECATFMSPPKNCPVSPETYSILLIASSLLAYFIIGAIIGAIIGKIKSNKKI